MGTACVEIHQDLGPIVTVEILEGKGFTALLREGAIARIFAHHGAIDDQITALGHLEMEVLIALIDALIGERGLVVPPLGLLRNRRGCLAKP
ncbi:MAG: hypothetical protein HC860_02325 [Alkalinema sp. RU_4_3]|nr:hypothetical protein [Alkalinema sp. RU_4_3]